MSKKIYTDTMVLGSGHSILSSHVPSYNIPINEVSDRFYEASKIDKESVDKFGLFGSNINYNTYYPDVTPKQFNPNEEEFIEPMFRLLSACIVSKNYNPTEFPEKVLKDSMHLLVGQTVNCDHETDVANAIGSVKSVVWQNSYTIDGVEIPAGINGVLKIDGVSNPRIARGINMDPPSIHSNSVTVQFEWKPSHQFEKEWEFYDKLGTYAEDGTMVRRIATRIISYKETSLVSHGADPFAQLVVDNKILNPEYAGAVYYSFSEAPINKEDIKNKLAYYDFKGNQEIDIMYNTINSYNKNKPQSKTNMDEKFLETIFGEGLLSLAEGDKPSMELALSQIKGMVSEITQLKESLGNRDTEIANLKNEVSNHQNIIESNKEMVNIGTQHLKEVRDNAITSYKKLMGENIDDNILALIESDSTSVQTLISLNKMYESQLEEKFPLHCSDCGSKNVSRASSVVEEENKEAEKNDSVVDVLGDIAKNKLK